MRYCVNCGAMNDTDAKFCSGCGKKFESAPQTEEVKSDYTQETSQAKAEQDNANTYTNQTSYTQNPYQNAGFAAGAGAGAGDPITENKYNGLSIASMILGICSIVFSAIIPIVPLAAAIVGLVMGNKVKKFGDNGMAKAGRITSIIGIVLTALLFVVIIISVLVLTFAIVDNPDILNDLYDFVDMYGYY